MAERSVLGSVLSVLSCPLPPVLFLPLLGLGGDPGRHTASLSLLIVCMVMFKSCSEPRADAGDLSLQLPRCQQQSACGNCFWRMWPCSMHLPRQPAAFRVPAGQRASPTPRRCL